MDIFLGKFNRVSEEGYEKFLTGLNLNYLLRLSTNEVVFVISGEDHGSWWAIENDNLEGEGWWSKSTTMKEVVAVIEWNKKI